MREQGPLNPARKMRSLIAVATVLVATAAWPQQPFDLDPSFRTSIPSVYVSSVLPMEDGKVWISGMIDGSPQRRLNHDGTWDVTAPLIYYSGFYRRWNDQFYCGVNLLKRYFQDGTVDTSFNMSQSPSYHPLQGGDYFVYPDGSVLVSGVNRLYDSIPGPVGYYCLLRFTNDGSLDTTFHPRTCAGSLDFFTELPNGQFIGSGSTSTWDGQAASNIIRFNADGSLDPSFQANVWWGQAYGFLPLPDGRVYAGGKFRINNIPDTLNLVRFMPDGSLDPTFNNTAKYHAYTMSTMSYGRGLVRRIFPLSDGNIIASGNFDHIDEQQRGCIALLDSSGDLLDNYFTGAGAGIFPYQGATSSSLGITPAPDGDYYIWGAYNGYDDGTTNDPSQRFVSRLHGLNVGIHEQQPGHVQPLQIAPNPSAGATVFSVNEQLTHAELYIHDASGRVVWQATWPAGAEQYELPAGALAPGAYVVWVASRASATAAGTAVYTGRLVVMP